ncbi:MAG: response regulator [Treponema sp.]|nr:response regulator [Treponema sp.]
MYNILLTDDEQIMIDSLKFIIEKNFSSDVQIFSCLSGAQALEVVAKNKIDIIFMDINMPALNGLETLKYIIQSKPDIVIIILSAFDQFQYAQEAVNLGVYKYLTKPVNRNTVVETVRNAMNLVDQRRGRVSNEVELHKKLDLVSPMIESDFIYSAAFSEGKDVSEYFSYFDIHDSIWCFCCLEIPRIKKQSEVYPKLRETLTSKSRCIIGSFMLNRIVVFFIFPSGKNESVIQDELSYLYKLLSISIGSGIRAGVSNFETDIQKTNIAYSKAVEVLSKVPAEGGIFFADYEVKHPEEKNNVGLIAEKIFGRVRAGDAGVMNALVSAYCNALVEKYAGDMGRVKNGMFELLVNVRNITSEIDNAYENDAFSTAFSVLSNTNAMEEIVAYMQARCCECASYVMQYSSKLNNPIIEKAVAFINEHIAENISLEDTAAEVNVSPFYLSKLFKEEKNENYISYITDIRMQKAQELLKNPRASIKEVSASVGYKDQNYFSRLFRNKFGLTPTEYRDGANGAKK